MAQKAPRICVDGVAFREGCLHGVKFLLVQGGAEGTDERVLVSRTVRCRVRDESSRFRGGRT